LKDLFSQQSEAYAAFRPAYPDALFEFLLMQAPGRGAAWDCATGNGQVAVALADSFERVEATDISENQLRQAPKRPNVRYSVQPAERTDFNDDSFDLVTVAQAVHWFNFERFYAEVRRTLRPGGLLAVIGYALPTINEAVDALQFEFMHDILEGCWEPERRYLDEHYRTIPFPFPEIAAPAFETACSWDAMHFLGYLSSWSAVQRYIGKNGRNPVNLLHHAIEKAWPPGGTAAVRFPVLLRLARLH
jgi:SAM-dependent methyltransferase